MKIVSIIPARGGSKGILKKNLQLLNGFPLIAYSILQSKEVDLINETYVSTEDSEIKNIALKYGASVIDRPKSLASDTASTEAVLLHASEYLDQDFDYMILLQPTSPLRYSKHIYEALELIIKENGDSLLSVYQNDSFLWSRDGTPINYDYKNRPRRQDKKWEYVENGSIYITKKTILNDYENRLGGKILTYIMPKWMSIEVDEPIDLELANFLIKTKYHYDNTMIKYQKYEEKIKALKLMIFDVDGVFTDGSVYLDSKNNEILRFSRVDGKGIELIKQRGFKTAVVTSEDSEIVRNRMEKLGIDEIFIGIKNKLKIYVELMKKYNIEDENICFLGDDIQDIELIKRAGFSCCPTNAQQIIKKYSLYQSRLKGGKGFVRDVCNLVLNYKE
jgi:YrbI family 3-deoxy-D-manno-octulosonate 8-phosphate phosphatase